MQISEPLDLREYNTLTLCQISGGGSSRAVRRVSMSVTSNSSHSAWDTQVAAAWAGSYSNLRQTGRQSDMPVCVIYPTPPPQSVGIFSSVYNFLTGYHVNLDRFNFFCFVSFFFFFKKRFLSYHVSLNLSFSELSPCSLTRILRHLRANASQLSPNTFPSPSYVEQHEGGLQRLVQRAHLYQNWRRQIKRRAHGVFGTFY